MGRIIKYNISKSDSIGTRTKSVSFTSSGGSSNGSTTTDTSDVNCRLWGNDFNGNDIDSTLYVYGDIYLYNSNSADDDVADDDDDFNDGTSGGGLLDDDEDEEQEATGTLFSYGVESTDIYAKEKLWIHYPTLRDRKENVADLIKNNADKIATNAANIQTNKNNIASNKAEIDALKGRVSAAETNITNISNHQANQDVMINANVQEILELKNKVGTNETNITNLYEIVGGNEGEGLLTEARVLELIKANAPTADVNAPVVLFSGTIYSDNNDGDKTWRTWFTKEADSSYHSGLFYLSMTYVEKDSIPALQIELKPKYGWSVKPTSVNAMVTKTHDYNVSTSQKGGNPRSRGYWMTGGVIDDKVYLGAWRTQDDNNDSVRFDVLPYRCQEINLTIYGKIYKTEE